MYLRFAIRMKLYLRLTYRIVFISYPTNFADSGNYYQRTTQTFVFLCHFMTMITTAITTDGNWRWPNSASTFDNIDCLSPKVSRISFLILLFHACYRVETSVFVQMNSVISEEKKVCRGWMVYMKETASAPPGQSILHNHSYTMWKTTQISVLRRRLKMR